MNNATTTPITLDRNAAAPSRATNSITLTAGSMMFPLSIYTAVSDVAINRSERLNGDPGISVGRVHVRKDTGDIIDPANVTRMAEAAAGKGAGKWVVVDDADLAEVYGDTGEAKIVSFVPAADAGRYVIDGLVQVRARNDKRASAQVANQAAFSLLLTGMANRQVQALIRFVVRGGPRFGLLDHTGDMRTIITADAVREARELPVIEHADGAIDMMGQFIDSVGVMSEPVIDDTPVKVQEFIDSKAASCGVAVGDSPASAPSVVVVDVMAELAASIAASMEARKSVKKAVAKKAVAKKATAGSKAKAK